MKLPCYMKSKANNGIDVLVWHPVFWFMLVKFLVKGTWRRD